MNVGIIAKYGWQEAVKIIFKNKERWECGLTFAF